MALTGTLKDLSIVELIQFPYAGRKTGKLVISQSENLKSILYYDAGKMVHAENNQCEGFEVIVDLLGWETGKFEFVSDEKTDRHTIELDLHRLVMQGLKVRDERRYETERRRKDEEARKRSGRRNEQVINGGDKTLTDLLKKNPDILYLCVTDPEGAIIAKAAAGKDAELFDNLNDSIRKLHREYPRKPLLKSLIQDENGVVSSLFTDNGFIIVMVTVQELPLGRVSIKLSRIEQDLRNLKSSRT